MHLQLVIDFLVVEFSALVEGMGITMDLGKVLSDCLDVIFK